MNLFDLLEREDPPADVPTLLLDGRGGTYAAFFARVRDLSDRLAAAGVRQGQCVGIAIRNPVGYRATVLALVRFGAIASEFQPGWPTPMRQAIVRRHRLAAVVVDDAAEPVAIDEAVTVLSGRSLFSDRPPGFASVPAVHDAGALPWVYVLSSGTTGMPKTVVRSQAALLSLLQVRGAEPMPGARVMPLSSLGMIWIPHVAIEVLLGRGTLVLSTSHRADDLPDRIERDAPTHLVGSTDAASKLAWYGQQHADRFREPCRGIEELQLSGSRLSDSARAVIGEVFPCRLAVILGSSEIGPIARRSASDPDVAFDHDGRLYPGVEVQAVDEIGAPLPAGVVGRLGIRWPAMTLGCLDDNGTLVPHENGWFVSDDRGAVDAAGFVRLNGRVSEVLNLAGRKVDPQTVERELERHPDIVEAALVAAPVRRRVRGAGGADRLRPRHRPRGGPPPPSRPAAWGEDPRFVLRTESLPRNAMGKKLMRDRLAGSPQVDLKR